MGVSSKVYAFCVIYQRQIDSRAPSRGTPVLDLECRTWHWTFPSFYFFIHVYYRVAPNINELPDYL